MSSLLIYNVRLVDAQTDQAGALYAQNGKIAKILYGSFSLAEVFFLCGLPAPEAAGGRDWTASLPAAFEVIDGEGLALMPSFTDMHAHFRYPGQPQKEELATALRAAAAGGFGTLVLMPNTSPPVSSAEEARRIREEAAAFGLADVLQTVSITAGFDGQSVSHLEGLETADVPVVTEDGYDVADAAVMLAAMKICARKGIIVSCHSEDNSLAKEAKKTRLAGEAGKKSAERLLYVAENIATARNLALAKEAHCRVHIAHVSTESAIDAVRRAKMAGVAATCEVSPHHLSLTEDDGQLVNPPLRSEADRQALIEAVVDGTADVIATDHAPHTAADKKNGAPGFTGLETAFGVGNTFLAAAGKIGLPKLSALMAAKPAEILGLPRGLLREGFDADLTLADPDEEWTVSPSEFYSKGKNSPFAGKVLKGRPRLTIKAGRLVFDARKKQPF